MCIIWEDIPISKELISLIFLEIGTKRIVLFIAVTYSSLI